MMAFSAVGVLARRIVMGGMKKHKKVMFLVAIIGVGIKMAFFMRKVKKRRKWRAAEQDLVILHIFPRGHFTPNLSPFCLKLETYLKLAKIPYEPEFDDFFGPKGKCPWITMNGKEYGDSQLCIELLNKKFHKNLSDQLTPEERAIARAFRIMAEEHLYWCLTVWLWIFNGVTTVNECITVPWYTKCFMKCAQKAVEKSAWFQGIGRHTQDEITEMAVKDLKVISNFIGRKPFLMGETPCEEDCAIFGVLSVVVWNLPGTPFESQMPMEYEVLRQYCNRMKEEVWSDWGRCLNPPQA